MNKEEFILDASMKMLMKIIEECEMEEGIEDLAEECASAAEKIWDKAHPLI